MEPQPPKIVFDSEYGMPLVTAQTAIACARLVRDEDGEAVYEDLLLPNLFCNLEYVNGVRIGTHWVISPQVARMYMAQVFYERVTHADECDCEIHDNHHVEVLTDAPY